MPGRRNAGSRRAAVDCGRGLSVAGRLRTALGPRSATWIALSLRQWQRGKNSSGNFGTVAITVINFLSSGVTALKTVIHWVILVSAVLTARIIPLDLSWTTSGCSATRWKARTPVVSIGGC